MPAAPVVFTTVIPLEAQEVILVGTVITKHARTRPSLLVFFPPCVSFLLSRGWAWGRMEKSWKNSNQDGSGNLGDADVEPPSRGAREEEEELEEVRMCGIYRCTLTSVGTSCNICELRAKEFIEVMKLFNINVFH